MGDVYVHIYVYVNDAYARVRGYMHAHGNYLKRINVHRRTMPRGPRRATLV